MGLELRGLGFRGLRFMFSFQGFSQGLHREGFLKALVEAPTCSLPP